MRRKTASLAAYQSSFRAPPFTIFFLAPFLFGFRVSLSYSFSVSLAAHNPLLSVVTVFVATLDSPPLVVCLVCCCAKSSWVSEDIYLLLPIIINLPTTNNNNPLWVVRILLLLLLQAIHQHPIHNNHNDNDQTPKYVCPPNCRKNLLATFSWYYLLLACWLQSLACLLACWVQALGTISCLLVGYKLLVQ